MSGPIYQEMIQPKGAGYRSDSIKPYSHYREPVEDAPGRLAGNSRIWGDASPQVQSRVVDILIEAARDKGLNTRETAHVLAIARVESGFNPDAAAGTTSAAGLGQFIDGTGRHYGLGSNRFDAQAGARALVEHFIDNRDLARTRGQGEAYIYKYHHDGPSRDYGGLGLATSKVLPFVDKYEQLLLQQKIGAPDRAGQDIGVGAPTPTPTPSQPRIAGFDAAMQQMMPPQAGVKPHITGQYGEDRGSKNHGGVDFNYVGGQSGRNLQHPVVNSPVDGRIAFSGGAYGTVKIIDAQGNSHELLHLHSRSVKEGDSVRAGQPIGTMGGRGPEGPNQYAQHVHYQLRNPAGTIIDPVSFWNGRQVSVGGDAMPSLDTRGMQEKLAALGYTGLQGRPLQVDGIAGANTTHAVRAFQKDHGLEIDGIAGPATLGALASQKALSQQGSVGPAVQTLQAQLNQLGVTDARGRPLAVDGQFGNSTGQAVEAFQKANDLKPDGVVGPQTRQALEAALGRELKPAQAQPAAAATPSVQEMPLFQKLKGCLPDGLSAEKIAQAAACAWKAGIDAPDKVQQVHVNGSTAHVIGTTPGFRASVDLAGHAPSLQDSSQQLQVLTQQQEQQHSRQASAAMSV